MILCAMPSTDFASRLIPTSYSYPANRFDLTVPDDNRLVPLFPRSDDSKKNPTLSPAKLFSDMPKAHRSVGTQTCDPIAAHIAKSLISMCDEFEQWVLFGNIDDEVAEESVAEWIWSKICFW